MYAIFIGATNESGTAIALDSSGDAWITGITHSVNFPTKNPFQATYGGGDTDGFVSEVSPDGNSLLFSSYLGGMSSDSPEGIAIDPTGGVYVAMQTISSDLPVANNAFQKSVIGGWNGYVTKILPGTIVWATYLGASRAVYPWAIAVDQSGHAFIVGRTDAPDFPVTSGAYEVGVPASSEASFVTKFTADGSGLVYSTYLGGTSFSVAFAVAIDAQGNAYVGGTVYGSDYPVKNAIQANYGGGETDAFVTELTAAGDDLVFSTFLGGSNSDSCNGQALALGPDGSIYVGGVTNSPDFPTKNSVQQFSLPVITEQNAISYVTQLAPGGDSLVYSTFFGGSDVDSIFGLSVDSAANVFFTGYTRSTDMPTKNAYQSTFGTGITDAFLARFAPDVAPQSPFSVSPVILSFQYVIGGATPAPQTIAVTSNAQNQAFTPSTQAGWLSLSSSAATAPATVTVTLNPAGLAAGQHTATVQIDPLTSVQVNLNILNPAPSITSVSPSVVPIGGDATVTITGTGFASGAVVQLGSSSLTTTFVNASTLQFVIPSSLASSSEMLSFTVVDPFSEPSLPFEVQIGTPAPMISAVTNAGSYASTAVAPGELITVFGTAMGPTSGAGGLSTMIGSVQILFDGKPATLLYAQAGQVSDIVPYEVAGQTSTQVVVEYNGQQSSAFTLPVAASAPALFTDDTSGKGQGAVLNQDGSLNSPSHPAAPGSVVVLYGTGAGQTNPPGVDGQVTGTHYQSPCSR